MNNLTPREWAIVQLLWDGHSNESISFQLNASEWWVKRSLTEIMRKTATMSRLDLAMQTFKACHKCRRIAL